MRSRREFLQANLVVDLVFTDINLPGGMNGLELAEWTSSNRPGVKILVTTGAAMSTEVTLTIEPILAKPYTERHLVERVNRALMKGSDDETTQR
jgi:CheY-like chemotaxis protein